MNRWSANSKALPREQLKPKKKTPEESLTPSASLRVSINAFSIKSPFGSRETTRGIS